MLILRMKREKQNTTRKGREKTLPLRAMPRPLRPGKSSFPALFPATLQPEPRTILPLNRAFHAFFSSASSGSQVERDSVGTCQFLFMSCLPPQRLLGPCFQTSKRDLFLDSSQDNEMGYLTYCFQLGSCPRTSLGTVFSGSSQYPPVWKDILPIHTKTKSKRFYIKGKSKHFQK